MKTLEIATYTALREKIRQTLIFGQRKIEEAKVQAYWQTGQYINRHIQVNGGRAEYGKRVVRRLSGDIKLHYSVLQKCSQFAEMFPDLRIVSARRQLTWAHYRALLAVSDQKKRLVLADEAAKEEWTSRDLEIEVRNLLWEKRVELLEGKTPSLLPVPVLGPFYTYKVIAPETIHSHATEPLLDVGFSGTKKLTQFISARAVKSSADSTWDMGHKCTSAKISPETIVISTKNAQGNYKLSAINSKPEALYNYQAFVTKVIDGDTLKLEIDTGFDDQKHETIRLKGIDCPEINTPEGRAAKRFVERELAHCEFIVLKSTRSPRKEKWGRYLGDIFYTNKEGKQVYLNNLLLEKGHAVRVRE